MMKRVWRHVRDLMIPVFMTLLLPLMINLYEHQRFKRPLVTLSSVQMVVGVIVGLAGLAVMISSIVLMIRVAKSTVMPWDPSQRLVIAGPYRHLRNPMILGVVILLIGEALVLSSFGIAILAVVFFFGNTFYFIYSEEPKLEERFGQAYRSYKDNVPRWLPRVKAWKP